LSYLLLLLPLLVSLQVIMIRLSLFMSLSAVALCCCYMWMICQSQVQDFITFVKCEGTSYWTVHDVLAGTSKLFLGIDITHIDDDHYLSQHEYIQYLLAHSGLTDTKSLQLLPWSYIFNCSPLMVFFLRIHLDIAMWLVALFTLLPPDRILQMLCAFLFNLWVCKLLFTMPICFMYLLGTPSWRLFYPKSNQPQLHAYSDATWASDHVDRRSTTGYCIFSNCMEVQKTNYSFTVKCKNRT
jgi:hypothetical protein